MDTKSPGGARSRPGVEKRRILIALQVLVVLAVVAGVVALYWMTTLPERVDDQQTIVLGTTRFAPDSDASLRVVVQDFAGGQPVAGAQVVVSLQPEGGPPVPLFEGQTDETGSLPVQFYVPAEVSGEAELVVETRSKVGQDRVQQPVTIQRDYRLLLTTDKPLYQPGQTVHMRALAFSTLDLTSAYGVPMDFLVEDPKGNKVYRQTVTASEYGIAAVDFTLADLVNQGDYKLSVSIGETRSEKTIEVRPYVLPKFAVNISTDRSYYLVGQQVEGVVQADYFFGKPVASGRVQIVGSVWDVERTVVVDLRGQTDENGTYAFRFDLPEYFAGTGLESGQAQFALEVTVIDQAEHAEQTSLVLPIAEQPLVIEAVAESGLLKPGVENVVYILTSYPDGRPAPAQLQVQVNDGIPVELSSGQFGLAEFILTPSSKPGQVLDISALDESGLRAEREVSLDADEGADHVLLRADRAAYVVGETMHLVAFTPIEVGSIYLDIVKAGQTLSTRSARVTDGRAEFYVDVSPDLYGTLELHAYKVLLDGTIVRDTRLVVVDAPNELTIGVTTDKDTYLPGEVAGIAFQTSGTDGSGVQAALGLSIVDESVFALQRQDPGFAKLYFMLQQELLEPFYQIKEFEFPAVIPPDQIAVREAQDDAAKATWAGVEAAVSDPINSRQEKLAALFQAQMLGFLRLGHVSTLGSVFVPLALWVIVLVALIRARAIENALVRLLVATGVVLVLTVPALCGVLFSGRGSAEGAHDAFLFLLLAFLLGALVLIVHGWMQRDVAAQFVALLTLAWAALIFLLDQALGWGAGPPFVLIALAVLGALMIPGVYLLFGQGLWVQQRRVAGATATGMGVLAVFLLLLLPFFLSSCGPMATPARETAAAAPTVASESSQGRGDSRAEEPPLLRQWFPETLYWAPEVLTDEAGFVSLDVPMADSITTWRLTALASSQDGWLGFTTHGIRVFQDFFVDLDLPVALTQGDEISIPVGVFNYLPQEQQVRLVVQEEPWFELLGPGEQTLTIASNDIDVVYFPIRAVEFGRQGFQVTAWGEQMSDTIRREVSVVPDGREIWQTESNWLRESQEVAVEIPVEAVKGASYVEVKIYPGVLAQTIEGLEKILRLPHG